MRAAFCWLEQRDPPEIIVPEARPASRYTLFVPNNDGDKKFDRQDRLASKIVRPHRLTARSQEPEHGQRLHYLWSIPEGQWSAVAAHARVLCGEARYLIALGWGIDQAVGDGCILTEDDATKLAGERWKPWPEMRNGRPSLRVPTEGSLKDLEEVHASFLKRWSKDRFNPSRRLRRFNSVMYVKAGGLPKRRWAEFELPEGVAFRQEDVVKVAAMLRSLTCDEQRYRNRQDFGEQFPNDEPAVYLAGHVEGNRRKSPARFSYLPLPTIGHEHADGMIRRLLIAEPYGGDGSRAQWAQQRLQNQVLRDAEGNDRGVLLRLWRTRSRAMVGLYVGEQLSWSTVTPVILPGYDDGKYVKAEKLFLEGVEQAGLAAGAVAEVVLRKAPFWPGSQHPRHYYRPAYLERLPGWHAYVVFREPVPGPLAIGAGRHVGLGVLAGHAGLRR